MNTNKGTTTLAETLTQAINLVNQLADRVISLEKKVQELEKAQTFNQIQK